jgi:hypothetical protein
MNGNHEAGDWQTSLGNFAAELTEAAYPVALKHGLAGSWIDLELDLRKVLAATLERRGRQPLEAQSLEQIEVWREALLSELTRTAYDAVLQHGLKGPFIKVELDVYRALRSVIQTTPNY